MELRHLRYFSKVAECLSFREASRQLNVAQPALSQQIANLEDEMGLKLFLRSRRGISLTAAGQLFKTRAAVILGMVDTAVGDAQRASLGQIGAFKVGYDADNCFWFLPDCVREFTESFPSIEPTMRALHGNGLDLFLNSEIDVSLCCDVSHISKEDFFVEQVAESGVYAALDASHPLAQSTQLTIEQLKDSYFALSSLGNKSLEVVLKSFLKKHGLVSRIRATELESHSLLDAISARTAVGFLPGWFHHWKNHEIKLLPLEGLDTKQSLYMVSPKSIDQTIIGAFREQLHETLAPHNTFLNKFSESDSSPSPATI